MPPAPHPDRIEHVRAFNRFYTRRIGVLHEGLLHTDFTLTESRLLWELAHRDDLTATQLAQELDLDAGYLSRPLRALKEVSPFEEADLRPWTDDYSDILGPFLSKRRSR